MFGRSAPGPDALRIVRSKEERRHGRLMLGRQLREPEAHLTEDRRCLEFARSRGVLTLVT